MEQQDDNNPMAAVHSSLAVADHVDFALSKGCCPCEVNGNKLIVDPRGVLFWPATSTLIVADLHLEKGSSIARRGQLLPPYDTLDTLRRLTHCIEFWKPDRLIALGDSFHDGEASARLPEPARAALDDAMSNCRWVWITGNHDPEPPEGLGGIVHQELRQEGLIFRHEPQTEDALGELAGHLHPKARIVRRGRSVRRSCFIGDENRMILPSFGAYTGGLSVLHAAFESLFKGRDFHAYMRGDDQVYKIAGREIR